MEIHRTELNELAPRNTPLLRSLEGNFNQWALEVGLEERSTLVPRLVKAWEMESIHR